MRSFYELKQEAQAALRGNWGIAIGASLLASLLGGASGGLAQNLGGESEGVPNGPVIAIMVVSALSALAFSLFVSSLINVGYRRFQLNLLEGRPLSVSTLFEYFSHWGSVVRTVALQTLHIFVGTLLLFIPGLIASYNYAMVPYLLAEDPTRPAKETLALSKRLMYGHRFEYFCLSLSFFGWALLCVLTLGIGYIWLYPYMEATNAAFYRELTAGTTTFYAEN